MLLGLCLLYAVVWSGYYNEAILQAPFYRRGNWVMVLIYGILLTFFMSTYGGFKIGYLKNGAWVMYEYEVQEIQSPPGYGCSEETFSIVFDREKEAVIQLYELSITNKKTRAQYGDGRRTAWSVPGVKNGGWNGHRFLDIRENSTFCGGNADSRGDVYPDGDICAGWV